MALVLKNIFTPSTDEIAQNYTIESWHVSQSVDALTGRAAYDVTISGSLNLTGSTLTGSTANITSITGSLLGTASTASKATQVVVSSSITTNNQFLVPFVPNTSNGYPNYAGLLVDSGSDYSGLWYNPSTNTLSASVFFGTASYASQASTASYYQYGTDVLAIGAFSDRTTQTVLQNTSASLTFDTTDISRGVSIGTPTSRLVVSRSGIYNLQFSVQIALSAGANGTAYLWLMKNGINQVFTNTGVYMQNANDKHVAAWNFVLSLSAGDYLELVMYANGGNVQALTEAAIPGIGGNGNVGVPSIIATLTQIT